MEKRKIVFHYLPLSPVLQVVLGVQGSLWHPKHKTIREFALCCVANICGMFYFCTWNSHFHQFLLDCRWIPPDLQFQETLEHQPDPLVQDFPCLPGNTYAHQWFHGCFVVSPMDSIHYFKETAHTNAMYLTLSPTRPSLPGDPSAPAIPWINTDGGSKWENIQKQISEL